MRKVHALLVVAIALTLFSSEAHAGNPFKKAWRWIKGHKTEIGAGAAIVTGVVGGRAVQGPNDEPCHEFERGKWGIGNCYDHNDDGHSSGYVKRRF